MPGYGASPVERAAFIVETIRDHLTRTGCTVTSQVIEVIAAELAARVFHADYAEVLDWTGAQPGLRDAAMVFRPAELGQRKLVKNSAMSFANSSGCSAAAKCPPLR